MSHLVQLKDENGIHVDPVTTLDAIAATGQAGQILTTKRENENTKVVASELSIDKVMKFIGSLAESELPKLTLDDFGTFAWDTDAGNNGDWVYWNGYNWQTMNGTLVDNHYLAFSVYTEPGSVITDVWVKITSVTRGDTPINFEYSTDGLTWLPYSVAVEGEQVIGQSIKIPADGSRLYLRGNNESLWYRDGLQTRFEFVDYFGDKVINGCINASGDITSLLNNYGGDVSIPEKCFTGLFQGCAALRTGPNLPSKILGSNCYESTFSKCANITTHNVETVNDSFGTFDGNTSCTTFTINSTIPPYIDRNDNPEFLNLDTKCVINVPLSSVEQYRAVWPWNEYKIVGF